MAHTLGSPNGSSRPLAATRRHRSYDAGECGRHGTLGTFVSVLHPPSRWCSKRTSRQQQETILNPDHVVVCGSACFLAATAEKQISRESVLRLAAGKHHNDAVRSMAHIAICCLPCPLVVETLTAQVFSLTLLQYREWTGCYRMMYRAMVHYNKLALVQQYTRTTSRERSTYYRHTLSTQQHQGENIPRPSVVALIHTHEC